MVDLTVKRDKGENNEKYIKIQSSFFFTCFWIVFQFGTNRQWFIYRIKVKEFTVAM